MKKILSLLFSAFLLTSVANAQDGFKCGNVDLYNRLILQYPEMLNVEERLERFTEEYALHQAGTRDASAPTFIIPVVFHIIHNYGPENISDAQVYDAVRQINEDFRKMNADTSLTIAAFQSIAADAQIEFRLARKDPNGNCTNGIDRVQSDATYQGNEDAKLNGWPRDKYLNIWVVQDMEDEGVAGYSYTPSGAQFNPDGDGIILIHNYVGVIGTSTNSHAHTLSHEIGHYLNLKHPWGSTNSPGVSCGSDNVNDTPTTKGWTSCSLNGISCGGGVENVQNIMEYSYCSTMFTAGQRTRMHAALNSGTSDRDNLWSASNLLATGTDNLDYAICSPEPLIVPAAQQFVCAGDTVFFNSQTLNAPASSWNWSFNGGAPASSTDSLPYSIYNTVGSYNVSLTTANAEGSNTTTANGFVNVLPNTGQHEAVTYIENFEAITFPNNEWSIVNTQGTAWTRVTNTGNSGTACMRLSTSGGIVGQQDNFITPTFDLAGIANPTLHFSLAFAQKTSGDADQLRVFVSEDCGQTWKLRYSKTGQALATAPVTTGNFTPSDSHWRTESVNLTPFADVNNLRVRFEFTFKGGNNIYVDDINFNQPATSLKNIDQSVAALSVFPNPSTGGELAASFNLTKSLPVTINLVAADGRSKELAQYNRLEEGHQLLRFDTQNLPSGFYTMWIQAGDNSYSHPVIIKR